MPDPVITVKLPALPLLVGDIEPDDKIFVFDSSAGMLKHAEVSQLPFGTGDGGSGGSSIILPATFVIENTSDAYSFSGGNTIITDTRLLGASGYAVRTTQLNNAAFRYDELVYDSVTGVLTISDFELQDNELLIIDAPGKASGGSGGGSYEDILARLIFLEAIAAPFKPTALGIKGGMILWRRPANQIPAGWAEVIEWRGRLAIGWNPDDPDFAINGLTTGGEKKHTNTLEEMVPHDHDYTSPNTSINYKRGTTGSELLSPSKNAKTSKTGGIVIVGSPEKVAKPYSILNPYRTVMFIEFVGIAAPPEPAAPILLSVIKSSGNITISWNLNGNTPPAVTVQHSYDEVTWSGSTGSIVSPRVFSAASFSASVVYFRIIAEGNAAPSNTISVNNA